jgi:hypothetical protein
LIKSAKELISDAGLARAATQRPSPADPVRPWILDHSGHTFDLQEIAAQQRPDVVLAVSDALEHCGQLLGGTVITLL